MLAIQNARGKPGSGRMHWEKIVCMGVHAFILFSLYMKINFFKGYLICRVSSVFSLSVAYQLLVNIFIGPLNLPTK